MIGGIEPWSRPALRRVVVAHLIALVLGAIAWSRTNAQDGIRDQIVWLNLAILAAMVAGTAQACWLLAGRRVVSLQRRAALARLEADKAGAAENTPAAPVTIVGPGQRVAIWGASWHHDPTCLLVKDKEVVVVDTATQLEPCDVCRR